MKSMGVVPGIPDMVMIYAGRAHFLELKASKGRLTPVQIMMGEDLINSGAKYSVAYSLDEAMDIVRHWDLVRAPMRVLADIVQEVAHGNNQV